MIRRVAAALLAGCCLLALARAQSDWKPTERINYVIGVAPGGTVDLYARGIKDRLDALKLANGQTILAENKVGAGGALAGPRMTSLSVVSLIAIVPDRECRIPTLIVSSSARAVCAPSDSAASSPRAVSDRERNCIGYLVRECCRCDDPSAISVPRPLRGCGRGSFLTDA